MSERTLEPRRPFHGWVMVGALSITETISFGILVYAFTVFIIPMRDELGWSVAGITGAFSLGLLVAGLAAVPVGKWLDRQGARLPMSLGSLLAAVLLFGWANVEQLMVFYLLWVGMGVAMAGVLYEPAFFVLTGWFRRDLSRAITVLTFLAGFASVIFIPLAGVLVDSFGWRTALRVLASIQLLTLPLHALLLRRSPEDLGLTVDGGRRTTASSAGSATTDWPDGSHAMSNGGVEGGGSPTSVFATAEFRYLAVAFSLSTFVITALGVHLVPLLLSAGWEAQLAAAIGGAIGLVALPGRLVFTPLGAVWPRRLVTASIFLLQAAGISVLISGGADSVTLWIFVALYGAGFGAITPARAALLAEYFGSSGFGSINGRMALLNSLARAAAPVSTGALVTAWGGDYRSLLVVLFVASVAAAVFVALARRPGLRGAAPSS